MLKASPCTLDWMERVIRPDKEAIWYECFWLRPEERIIVN